MGAVTRTRARPGAGALTANPAAVVRTARPGAGALTANPAAGARAARLAAGALTVLLGLVGNARAAKPDSPSFRVGAPPAAASDESPSTGGPKAVVGKQSPPGASETAAPAGQPPPTDDSKTAAGKPPSTDDPKAGAPTNAPIPLGAADAPTVAARADKSEVHVGDPITLTITAVGPRNTPVNLPTNLELAPFALLDRRLEEKDLGDGRMSRTFVLSVATYEPGEVHIPAVEVTYLGKGGAVLSTHTAPLPVKVKSLIANEPEPQLKDNAPPVTVLEENLLPIYIGGGLAAAAIGALTALWIRRRLRARAAIRPAPPPRPAHEIALERLDRLGAAGFVAEADYRPFYFSVSEVIREYLGARFSFDSLEMTTEELLDELRRRAARELVIGEIAGWLTACDLVKFAKISPGAAEARGAFETAIRIVESTRPRPAPAAGPMTALKEEARG